MEPVKLIVANNLSELRKAKGLTQQQLADKFCYSDKSISKWEHGETLPDIETLKLLCDFYGVTLDYLVSDIPLEERQRQFAKEDQSAKTNKLIITSLCVSVVWILATVIFFFASALPKFDANKFHQPNNLWLTFIWPVPASFLILLIFNSIWGKKRWNPWIIVPFLWSFLGAVYLQAGASFPEQSGWTLWGLFVIGVPLTISVILFGKLKSKYHRK